MSPLYDISNGPLMLEEEEVVVAVIMEPMLRSVVLDTNDDKCRSKTDVVVTAVGRDDDEEDDDAEPIGPFLQRSPPSFINHWGANLEDDNSIHLDPLLDDTTSSPSTTTTITNNLWEVQPKTKLSVMSCLTIQEEDEDEEELTEVEVEEKVDGLPVVVASKQQQLHQSPPSFINHWGASLDTDYINDLEDISLADTATTGRTDILVGQQMQSMVSCLTIREEEEEEEDDEGEEELVDQWQQQPPFLPVRSIRRKNQHMSMISMISYLTTPEEDDDEDEDEEYEGEMHREDDDDDDDDSTISDYSCGDWSSKYPSQDDGEEDDFTLYPATTNSEMVKDLYQQEKRQRRLRKKKQQQQQQQQQQRVGLQQIPQAEQEEPLESSVAYDVSKYMNRKNPTDTKENTAFAIEEDGPTTSGRTLSLTTTNTQSTTSTIATGHNDPQKDSTTKNHSSTREMNFLCQVMALPKVMIKELDPTLSTAIVPNSKNDDEKEPKTQTKEKKSNKKRKSRNKHKKNKTTGGVDSKTNGLFSMLQLLNCTSRKRRSNHPEDE